MKLIEVFMVRLLGGIKRVRFLFCLLIITLFPYISFANKISDAELKAVYLFRIANFIKFDSNINFCVLSDKNNVIEGLLKDFIAKKKNKNIKVIPSSYPEKILNCSIIYISSSKEALLDGLLAKIVDKKIVTISDIKGFIYRGGIFGFNIDKNNKLKVSVNLTQARKQGVLISTDLLNMIRVIE